MKKGWYVLILLTIVGLSILISTTITGDVITGEVSNQPTNVSLFINPLSQVVLVKPENKTYISNESLLLEFTQVNTDFISYWLDVGSNTTITGNTTFNVSSDGLHTLYLYSNNSFSSAVENVSFTVDTDNLTILYTNYLNVGNSTDFYRIPYEDLVNLSDIILEDLTWGKIQFLDNINVRNDLNASDEVVDLDNNTEISLNNLYVNSTALPNFDGDVRVWMYNVAFNDPTILKNGVECTTCTLESFASNILQFTDTSVGRYSAEESSVVVTVPGTGSSGGGGGGGSGGMAVEPETTFEIEPEILKVFVKKGLNHTATVTIRNTGEVSQDFSLSVKTLEDFIEFSEDEFTLLPGNEQKVKVNFFASDFKPETYTGKIIVTGNKFVEEVPVLLNIKSTTTLFDVILDVPSSSKEVKPGQDVSFQMTLFNLGTDENADVLLKYSIKDFEGNKILEEQELVNVATQLSFKKTLPISASVIDGEYAVGVVAEYEKSVGAASDIFYVTLVKLRLNTQQILALALALLLLILFIIIGLRRRYIRKLKAAARIHTKEVKLIEKRVHKGHMKSADIIADAERISLKIALLSRAHEKGYISEKAYKESLRALKKLSSELKRGKK